MSLFIVRSRALVDGGALRRKWWPAHKVAERADIPISAIDAAIVCARVGRWVAISVDDITGRHSVVSQMLMSGEAIDLTKKTTIHELLDAIPAPRRRATDVNPQ